LETIRRTVFWASDLIWGPWTILLLLGTGIYLTLRFRLRRAPRRGARCRRSRRS
jgi:AGCS family alanine or glycine:cation symporter